MATVFYLGTGFPLHNYDIAPLAVARLLFETDIISV